MKELVPVIILLSTVLVYSANIGVRDYHREIGIPLATKLKQLEEAAIAKEERIAGGSITDISEIPYQAGIVIDVPSVFLSCCGGALISSTRVLTAASCQFDDAIYTVALGSNYVFFGGLRVNATNFIPHHGYTAGDPSYINDIAMLHIPTVSFTNVIQPIALPSNDEVSNNFAGQMALTSGYGITPESPALDWNQILRAVDVQVITPAECGILFGTTGSRDESICTSGSGGVGICASDSGGPLTTISNDRRILIGLTSFGAGCGLSFPSGYVRITQYLSWISST
ncbi:brachyurin [Amyelois transitella]|uniref:brachyurin n=1 Tax=Amyelois transitella TaxID=680683 RepID=UPI0029902949|nr:brachyurin [Amyelois transitella]